MTKPTANQVTFSPEQLQAVISQAIREHEASKAEKAKADSSGDADKACIRAFRKAGFGDVKPRVDVKTYDLWIKEGRRVKAAEKGIRVKNFRLFHLSQTEAITAKEAQEYLQAKAERRAAKSGSSSDLLPKVTPIGTAKGKKPVPQPSA